MERRRFTREFKVEAVKLVRETAAVAPNVLDRSFAAPAPNHRWIADFTYV
jgi:transposase InsO family protein